MIESALFFMLWIKLTDRRTNWFGTLMCNTFFCIAWVCLFHGLAGYFLK